MRFDNKTTKQLATKVSLGELSGVTSGAHEGANVTLFKSDDPEEIMKNMFLQAVANMETKDEIYSVINKVWDYTDALYDAAYDIIKNIGDHPDPIASFGEILDSFGSVVTSLKKNAKDEVAKAELKKIVNKDSLKVMRIIKDSNTAVSATPLKKEDEEMATKEEAQAKEITQLKKALAIAVALGSMSDTQKSYHANLDEASQTAFASMSAIEMDSAISKSQEADPVLYKARDGEEFRKSDGERIIKMVKRQDATDEENEKLQKEATDTRLQKAAADTMGHLPGEVADKAAMLKAIETITDLDQRGRISKIIAAQNDGMGELFTDTGGVQTSKQSATANEQLDDMAKAHQEKEGVTFDQALDAVCQTTEGAKLYAQI